MVLLRDSLSLRRRAPGNSGIKEDGLGYFSRRSLMRSGGIAMTERVHRYRTSAASLYRTSATQICPIGELCPVSDLARQGRSLAIR